MISIGILMGMPRLSRWPFVFGKDALLMIGILLEIGIIQR